MTDHDLEAYDFPLPEERIAQFPPAERGGSRLLCVPRHASAGAIRHEEFCRLADCLPPGSLLVANNSRVLPARLTGRRAATGGKAEFLLLTPLPLLQAHARADGTCEAEAQGLLRTGGRPEPGEALEFDGGISLRIIEREGFGRHKVLLRWRGELEKLFSMAGSLPLPPYIRRSPQCSDLERYQTVYADGGKTGSVAAPTAGLHFTPGIREELIARGFEWREITLYVGYGTFSPVRCPDIREHVMHAEYAEICAETAQAVLRAKREGRPVVAVGTTSLRTLEGVASSGPVRPFSGWLDIFIYPGFGFRVADGLLTNFHLPKSSLLMLVSAFAGRERILGCYAEAVERGYNFFSYGDAMLIA